MSDDTPQGHVFWKRLDELKELARALIAEVRELREDAVKWQEVADHLDGRLGLPNDRDAVRAALQEYVAAEDALPDTFDSEDYRLSRAVKILVDRERMMSDDTPRRRNTMKRVIVESPFKGNRERNKQYLESCLHDCIKRGESPYASHKMLTDCLDDNDPKERSLGIQAGFAWKTSADLAVFYVDLGWSGGMTEAMVYCQKHGIPYETRTLPKDAAFWSEQSHTPRAIP